MECGGVLSKPDGKEWGAGSWAEVVLVAAWAWVSSGWAKALGAGGPGCPLIPSPFHHCGTLPHPITSQT